ncbi:phage protein NinX family protein [Pseudomonas monteilii]|uniref:phage protein NinX family protein n=1 Tax=Pseudomonas monteilii TaxID=76759 RepID=UPI0037F4DA09
MTDLIEVKTADLVGEALGWAVGTTEGMTLELAAPSGYIIFYRVVYRRGGDTSWVLQRYNPWEDWGQVGRLVLKHEVSLRSPQHVEDAWVAWVPLGGRGYAQAGNDPLIAICRAIVAADLGDTVKVPKLLKPLPQ